MTVQIALETDYLVIALEGSPNRGLLVETARDGLLTPSQENVLDGPIHFSNLVQNTKMRVFTRKYTLHRARQAGLLVSYWELVVSRR